MESFLLKREGPNGEIHLVPFVCTEILNKLGHHTQESGNGQLNMYGLSGTIQEESAATQRITTAPEAIAAAEKYGDIDHTKIVVHCDAVTNMWKVEFQRNYGARGYLYIYLDDAGNYYGSAEGERRA